jgi:hypothetical protein
MAQGEVHEQKLFDGRTPRNRSSKSHFATHACLQQARLQQTYMQLQQAYLRVGWNPSEHAFFLIVRKLVVHSGLYSFASGLG